MDAISKDNGDGDKRKEKKLQGVFFVCSYQVQKKKKSCTDSFFLSPMYSAMLLQNFLKAQ